MTKILLVGAQLSGNFGGPSLLSSTIKVLSNVFPKPEFVLLSRASKDCKLSKMYGIRVVSYPRKTFLRYLFGGILDLCGINSFHISTEILNEYKSADFIVDIWGLGLGEGLILLLMGKLLRKPVIKYTADMGPFRTKRDRFFAKFYLDNIDLILVRSEMTQKYLFELGVTTPIRVCPDTAFLLDWVPSKKSQIICKEKSKKKTIVGISVSHIAERNEQDKDEYVTMMARIGDYLIEKVNAFVILIPNEIRPKEYDDVHVAKKIYRKINGKANVMLLTEEYSAGELKGIIKELDLFLGARYHSIVAAISMLIPTLAISWHYKYYEVMKLMGQEEYVCDIKSLNFAELREMVNNLWENKEKIKVEIASRIPLIKESILSGGKIVKRVLMLR